MALRLLWLGLVLLGALQTQAQASIPKLIPAPPLRRVPVQPDFQDEKSLQDGDIFRPSTWGGNGDSGMSGGHLFQGKWYVLGLAGNEFNKEKNSQFKIYVEHYDLNHQRRFNVTSTIAWNRTCEHWSRTLMPTLGRGQYYLDNTEGIPGIQQYFLRVAATDYIQFAMLYFKNIFGNNEYFKITLYGRTSEPTPEMKKNFISLAKSLGLTDQHIIFPIHKDQCVDK